MKNPDSKAALEQFLDDARRDLFPKLKRSALSVCILNGTVDAKLAMELGACILFNKPILILIEAGTPIHPRLKLLADEWIEYDDIRNPTTKAKMAAAIQRLMEKVKR